MRTACLLLAMAGCLLGQAKPDPMQDVPDEPGLPRVLLIGDSISIGYTLPVRAQLQGKANVHRIPENAATTANGVAKLESWLGTGHWDVIHFNFGLHDLKIMDDGKHQVELEAYTANLRQIVARLKSTGARLIFATTTPVPDAQQNPMRKAADPPLYNAAARTVMQEAGVEVDDLYSLVLPRVAEIQRPANVHYTDAGYVELAQQVSAAILRSLDK